MRTYWPCGIRKYPDGHSETVSTYDSAFDLSAARKTIELWKEHYRFDLISAWVDVFEGERRISRIEVIEGWTRGMRVKIKIGRKYARWRTPRWADGEKGTIKRLNDRTATVELNSTGETIRADYWDLEVDESGKI